MLEILSFINLIFIVEDTIYVILSDKLTEEKVLFRYKEQKFTEIAKYSSEIVIPHFSGRFIVLFNADWVIENGRYSHLINSQLIIYDRETKEKRIKNIPDKIPSEINLAHIDDQYYVYMKDKGKVYFYNLLENQDEFQMNFNEDCFFETFIGDNKFCYIDMSKTKEGSNMHDLIIVEMKRK